MSLLWHLPAFVLASGVLNRRLLLWHIYRWLRLYICRCFLGFSTRNILTYASFLYMTIIFVIMDIMGSALHCLLRCRSPHDPY